MASSRSRRRAVTLTLVALVVSLGFYQAGGVAKGLRGAAGGILSPFTWTVNEIARPIGHLFAGAANYSNMLAQNQTLRAELGRAQMAASENTAALASLAQLEAQLHIPFVGSTPTVVAPVNGLSPTNFAATISIAKGSNDGILPGMPVVANGGLVGTVLSTTKHGSIVRLLTDPNSTISVTFGAQSVNALATGRGVNNGLALSAIAVSNPLRVGETLFTSALSGGTMPSGLPVARVTKLSITPGSSVYTATVTPLAAVNQLAYVDVVLWEPSA